jgi:hypothetical protein
MIAMATGARPTLIGLPALLVAVLIGVTVFEFPLRYRTAGTPLPPGH